MWWWLFGFLLCSPSGGLHVGNEEKKEFAHLQRFLSADFPWFPWLVSTSVAYTLQREKSKNESVFNFALCDFLLTAEERVEACWVKKEDRTHATVVERNRKLHTSEHFHWLFRDEEEEEASSKDFFWIPPRGEELGFVGKTRGISGIGYRIGLRVPFSAWIIDPCSRPKSEFRFGHACDPLSTKCVAESPVSAANTSFDSYACQCLEWYEKDEEFGKACIRSDASTRQIIFLVQLAAILVASLLSVAVFTQRKTKVMSSSMWPVTEVVVLGSILLYGTTLFRSIEDPSRLICILEPWSRELGFSLAYGALVLKIYRALVEFRTRKAHRWVVREKDIIRYLATIFAVVVFYMAAWTVTDSSGFPTSFCPVTPWHRVTEIGELLFLGVGLHMAYHLRNALAPWNERRWYSAALIVETIASVATILIRESVQRFGGAEDESLFLLLLYVARSHVATSIILILVFAPKFYYVREERRKRLVRRADGGTTRIVKALDTINGDLDLAEINLADMDPGDIRTELKRVYTQLELLRNKTMRKDNPHISKRRGGRKPTHRRFSLQKKGSREKALQRKNQRSFRYHGDDIEDSVCSIEGPSTYSEAGR